MNNCEGREWAVSDCRIAADYGEKNDCEGEEGHEEEKGQNLPEGKNVLTALVRIEDVVLATIVCSQIREHLQGKPLAGTCLLGGTFLSDAPRPAVLEVILHAAVTTHLLLSRLMLLLFCIFPEVLIHWLVELFGWGLVYRKTIYHFTLSITCWTQCSRWVVILARQL